MVSTGNLELNSEQCWPHFYFSERGKLISADNIDATFTDADFAEIEAFANDSVLV